MTNAADNSSEPAVTKVPSRSRKVDFWIVRACLAAGAAVLGYKFAPFGAQAASGAAVGFLMAMLILLAELRLRRAEISGLAGGAVGLTLGLLASLLASLVISRTIEAEPTKTFLEFGSLFACGYLGLTLGSLAGPRFAWRGLAEGREAAGQPKAEQELKLLDTSVLIDGRIADICDAFFMEGVLIVPRFVLHELQLVADSAEGLKRQRGRRGLEVLQRMQKMPQVQVRIADEDFPQAADVDHKLIEMARRTGAKIVTNDFNLNKVATVQGLTVMNVNQLANALKPAVLPGEAMRVFILREGKEQSQGVAYLDDGTMVVVDGARRHINRNVDVTVTSVHQTTAGKMIFGRLDERQEQAGAPARHAAVAGAGRPNGENRTDNASRQSGASRTGDSGREHGPRPAYPELEAD